MIYRRNLFSPRRFHESTVKLEDAETDPLLPTKGHSVDHDLASPLANGTQAILDSFAYLLSPEVTIRKLQEIFEKVRSPEVRLCLRAHGQMPQLLRSLHKVQDEPLRLLRLGVWHSLSLDANTAADLLETSCECLTADEAPAVQVPQVAEAVGPASGTLKRRRVQAGAGCGLQHWEELHRRVVASVKQEEPRFLKLLDSGASAERSIALLILWRCLGNLSAATAAPKVAQKLWFWFPRLLESSSSSLSSELAWEALERLARALPLAPFPPAGAATTGAFEALGVVLQAARHSLSNIAETPCLACLRALHALVTFSDDSRWTTMVFSNEMLELLVARCHNLDLPGQESATGSAAATRTVLGILGNLAARSQEVCEELSTMEIGQRPLPMALAKALAWYKEQLSDDSQTLEVEVHLNYAMASLLLGHLSRGARVAKKHLEEQLGSAEALLDILRTFTIFQDRCGILTDGSLLCVHTVMQFLAEADGVALVAEGEDGKLEEQSSEGDGRKLREMTPDQKATLLQMELTPLPRSTRAPATLQLTPPWTPPVAPKCSRRMELTPQESEDKAILRPSPPAGGEMEQATVGGQSFSPVHVYQRRRAKRGEH